MMSRRTRESGRTVHATILVVLALIVLGKATVACAQGVATGGTAAPARPLPPGMKAPTVSYEDLAAQAGLTGVEVSGADHGKQFIVESTGTGAAIFDYDNDGLPDIFLVNGGRLDDGPSDGMSSAESNLLAVYFGDGDYHEYAFGSLRAGASGYLVKRTSPSESHAAWPAGSSLAVGRFP